VVSPGKDLCGEGAVFGSGAFEQADVNAKLAARTVNVFFIGRTGGCERDRHRATPLHLIGC
jgi:hypothetical protein